MGSVVEGHPETSWTTRAARASRLALEVARATWRGRRHAGTVGTPAWRRDVERSSRRMLDAVAVEVEVRGARPLLAGPVLLVANHVSWIDVQALGAVAGTRFVAKTEVRDWPVVGAMAERFGTLFIRRGHRRDALRVKNAIAKLLVTGERVVIFPEGTTTDGSWVAPFHAALLQAAVDAAIPVQPVAIRYRDADGAPTGAAAFVDDMSFGESLTRVLARPRLVAELTFAAPIWAADKTRRELAARCREVIATALGLAAPVAAPARRSVAPLFGRRAA
jgi:1-acyl-sn-glycerol-3-phosphate acyltransferase